MDRRPVWLYPCVAFSNPRYHQLDTSTGGRVCHLSGHLGEISHTSPGDVWESLHEAGLPPPLGWHTQCSHDLGSVLHSWRPGAVRARGCEGPVISEGQHQCVEWKLTITQCHVIGMGSRVERRVIRCGPGGKVERAGQADGAASTSSAERMPIQPSHLRARCW